MDLINESDSQLLLHNTIKALEINEYLAFEKIEEKKEILKNFFQSTKFEFPGYYPVYDIFRRGFLKGFDISLCEIVFDQILEREKVFSTVANLSGHSYCFNWFESSIILTNNSVEFIELKELAELKFTNTEIIKPKFNGYHNSKRKQLRNGNSRFSRK